MRAACVCALAGGQERDRHPAGDRRYGHVVQPALQRGRVLPGILRLGLRAPRQPPAHGRQEGTVTGLYYACPVSALY
eukprot:2261361-Pyramimonas_sp.AAC.1